MGRRDRGVGLYSYKVFSAFRIGRVILWRHSTEPSRCNPGLYVKVKRLASVNNCETGETHQRTGWGFTWPVTTLTRHVYTTYVPRLYHVFTTYIPRLYHVFTTYIPRLYNVCTSFVPRLYHVCTTSLPRLYHVCTTSLPRLYHVFTTSIPRLYHVCTTSVPHL